MVRQAAWPVSGALAIRDKKATTFPELPPAPECDSIALSAENRGECLQNSPGDNNPPVGFPTVRPGYETARHFLSLFALFETCVVHTT